MRMIMPLLALALVGAVASASAVENSFAKGFYRPFGEGADRIFADGFEACCTLGGEVSGLTGSGLVLHLDAGSISENKLVAADGGGLRLYTFAHTAPPTTAYAVTVMTQPSGQTCTLNNASGTMGSTPVDNINATCVDGPASLVWDDGKWDDANWQ